MRDDPLDPIPLIAGAVAAVGAALAVRAFLVEPCRVQVTRQELPVAGLPEEWAGRRLVHLSDLHYGDPRSERLFRWMVRAVNEAEPDLIVVTGDFILHLASEAAPCAKHLKELRSRHGILGVLGDHDFVKKHCRPPYLMQGLQAGLESAGVRLLNNESIVLPGGLRIAGVEPATRKVWRADLPAALAGLKGEKPHLLLSHSPDVLPEAAEREIPLILCGHTHGGQVVAPFYGPLKTHTRVHRRHASGWSSRASTRLFTCRGLASHYSLRFLCPPEIAIFTLVPASPQPETSAAGKALAR